MEEPTEYLCKDCKHSIVSTFEKILSLGRPASYSYKCSLAFIPERNDINLVTGPKKTAAQHEYCSVARKYGKCGEVGRLWQPKNKRDLFKYLKKEHECD